VDGVESTSAKPGLNPETPPQARTAEAAVPFPPTAGEKARI
jgi:hypothetical protein